MQSRAEESDHGGGRDDGGDDTDGDDVDGDGGGDTDTIVVLLMVILT